ncbi:hypothetical protein EI555_019661, partial [Monodon monoceros]
MVTKGSPVTILSPGSLRADVYRLYRERPSGLWEAKAPQDSSNKASFPFESSSSSTAGSISVSITAGKTGQSGVTPCPWWGQVGGRTRVPSHCGGVLTGRGSRVWAQGDGRLPSQPTPAPRPVVASGESVSLACSSQFAAGTLHLLKEGGADPPDAGHRGPMGGDRPHPLHRQVTGVYREPSVSAQPGSLVLRGDSLIAGMYRKPSLLAQLWASEPCRENVTLQCRSEVWSDPLHLSKEGSLTPPQNLRLQDTAPPFQNNFTLSPVTSAHSGTYTCYSSLSTSPSLMSQPSDPWSSCSQARSPLPTSIEEPDPRLTALSQGSSELEKKGDTGTSATGGPTPRREGQYRRSPSPSTPLTPPQGPGSA